ncbi:uncharacterized protein LOC111251375 isoform X2 [Varroa destructor]|uniref:Uncharacterized protein n=1 Tax=Varroa destructor TaxID=109461 RepID=A0A7M7KHE9_VARDE|nr:uncharacterized protein LOC111251375 isoform X2 [Varroa destructor]
MTTVSEISDETSKSTNDAIQIDSLLSSSQFIPRVINISVVKRFVTRTSSSYSRAKQATPPMVRPVVDTAEVTALHFVSQMMAIVLLLPLPLQFADQLACASLTKFECLAAYKQLLVNRLYQLPSDRLKTTPVRDKGKSFYFELLRFSPSTKDKVICWLKHNLSFFVEIKLALLERVEGLLKSFRVRELGLRLDSGFEADLAGRIQKVKQLCEDAIAQQEKILNWALADGVIYNPLEPVLKHLQSAAQKLTSSPGGIVLLHDKVALFGDILKRVIKQIKPAVKDTERLSADVKGTIYKNAAGVAQAFLPQFALNSVQRLTDFSIDVPPFTEVSMDAKSRTKLGDRTSPAIAEVQGNLLNGVVKKGRSTVRKSVTIVEPAEIIGSTSRKTHSKASDNICRLRSMRKRSNSFNLRCRPKANLSSNPKLKLSRRIRRRTTKRQRTIRIRREKLIARMHRQLQKRNRIVTTVGESVKNTTTTTSTSYES